MIVNQWNKYHRNSNNPVGYEIHPMDGILDGTCLGGFIPCDAMIVNEENVYERMMDVLHAFSLMDSDGAQWGMDNGLINPLGYEVDVHAQLVLNNFKVVLAWIVSWSREGKFLPRKAHLIVEMPDTIIKQKHYETGNLCECNLGKYYVEIEYCTARGNGSRCYPRIYFWQKTKWYDGRDYYYKARHPHVSNGGPCWGDMEMNSYDPLKNGNVFASLGATRVFLKTYNRNSPYDPIARWQNEWWSFDLDFRMPNSFIVGGNELKLNNIAIPNPNSVAIDDDAMLNRHISAADQFNQDTGAFLAYAFRKLGEGNMTYSMPFHVHYIFNNIGFLNRMNVMPLITRLVLTREMSWLQALIVSIKILYSEWKNMTANAPKRWPQGTIKKSEYNTIRAWSNRPNESPYYKLPGFFLWRWNAGPNRLEQVTDQEMRTFDILKAIGIVDTIRARNVSFSFRTNRRNTEFSSDILNKVNDPEYLNMMEFTSFNDSEFPEADPANKRAVCKKLRAEINDLNGLYQNARYLQNKRFLTIIEREKEMISNEANNYRPVATKDRLPFESL